MEFLNKDLTDFCNEHNIIFIQSRPRNPKCNGIVEVSHKEIRKHVLSKYALNEDNDEDETHDFDLKDILLDAYYTHNNNIHTSTKKKPVDLIKNTDKDIYLEVLENIKNSLKRNQINYTQLKKNDYILLKPGCYLRGKLIKYHKCKNRIISVPGIVIKDYEGGLISFKPSVTIYDLIENEEYFTTTECVTSIDENQYDNLIKQFNKRKNKKEVVFKLKKPKNGKIRKTKIYNNSESSD